MDTINLNTNTSSLAQTIYGFTHIGEGREHVHFLMAMYTSPLSQGEVRVGCAIM